MQDHSEVLVFGLGAIGSFYAFILGRCSGVCLSVVARSNYKIVKSSGIRIDSEIHGAHTACPQQVLQSPVEARKVFDFVVCANKAIGQDAVAAALVPVVGKNTTIVIIQNGVGNEDAFRKAFPGNTIITCVTWVGSKQTSSGVVKHSSSERTQIGLYSNASIPQTTEQDRLWKFVKLLKAGGTPVEVEDDIQVARWKKVVWNCSWNSITSLTLLDTQTWLQSDGALQLTRDVMTEVIHVARRCNVAIEYDLVDELIDKINKMPGIYSSMHADRVAGRQMELDMILASPVRKAQELGVAVPVLHTLYTLLLALNKHSETKR